MTAVTIGIDVGGTKIAGALVEANGAARHEMSVPSPRTPAGADPGAAATRSVIESLLASAGADGLVVEAVGIGVPEYVTPAGRIASSEVMCWESRDLDGIAGSIDVLIDSDVRCAARAEYVVGGGSRFGSFLYVSIGTGISHTLCLDGQLWAGHRGEALALGELPVNPNLALRPDAPLTVEQQASGRAIEHCLQVRDAGDGDESERDKTWADEVRARAGRIAAAAVVSAVGLLDPEAVILGGGLGSSRGPYTDSLVEEAASLLARRPNAPTVVASRLAGRGGVVGAGLLGHQDPGDSGIST